MKAFHNDEKIKEKYLARVRGHQLADNLIRGETWDGHKGCAIGCTLENYDHKRYEIELGIPEWLAKVEDRLFEGMSLEKSKTFPEKFLESINIGSDLEKAKSKFLVMVLKSTLDKFDHQDFPAVKESIDQVIFLYESNAKDEALFQSAAAAADAAYTAAAAADAAAYTAAAAAAAADAAAAYTAAARADDAAAADAAAYAAAAAAYAAAAYNYFADQLLIILSEIKGNE